MSERVNEEKNLPADGTKRTGAKPDGTDSRRHVRRRQPCRGREG